MEWEARRRKEWEKSRRNGARWILVTEVARGEGKVVQRSGEQLHLSVASHSISFFFTDFPENWTRESMWIHFERFGRVIDVFIPTKKTRAGKCFGFVRYKGVTDPDKLVREVRGVAVGPELITFNVAKFGRIEKKVTVKSQQRGGNQEYHISPGWKTNEPPKRIGNATFAEVLMGKKERVVEVEGVKDEELNWLKNCDVGEVKNTEVLNDINHLL